MSLIDKSIILFIFLLSLSCTGTQAQIKAGSMEMKYEKTQTGVRIHLAAPTNGWLAIGFNHKDAILKADLLQFRVTDGKVYGEDQYVTAPGNHPSDLSLGGSNQIQYLEGLETPDSTFITFQIPWESQDPNDFPIKPLQPCWLILAYSISDDFDHHSIMRTHIPITW